MPHPDIRWEPCQGGYIAWQGDRKLAVLGTNHDQGLVRNGRTIYEPIDPAGWGLHFTAPALSVALLRAVLDTMPTEPCPLNQKEP